MSYQRFPVKFGKYILLERISSGGMAEVFCAKLTGAEEFERLLAIKCLLPHLTSDAEFMTMFVDEAKLAAQLNHAHIVQTYELGKLDDRLYIAMELVQGRDLRHILKQAHAAGMPIPWRFAVFVIQQAAEALDFAHRTQQVDGQPLGLVHRDVSPHNILVSYDGEVKVADFGIAKAEVRDSKTRAGFLKGKFAYMAPEQSRDGAIDHRADIFALGTLLYELLTGTKLFQADNDIATLERVREAKVPLLADKVPELPPELDAILARALAADPHQRFAWASELAETLTPFLLSGSTLFGRTQAKAFMHSLFQNDQLTFREKHKAYARVTAADCGSGASQQPHASAPALLFEAPKLEQGQAVSDPWQALVEGSERPTDLLDLGRLVTLPRPAPPHLAGVTAAQPTRSELRMMRPRLRTPLPPARLTRKPAVVNAIAAPTRQKPRQTGTALPLAIVLALTLATVVLLFASWFVWRELRTGPTQHGSVVTPIDLDFVGRTPTAVNHDA